MDTKLTGTVDQIDVRDVVNELNEQNASMREAFNHPFVWNGTIGRGNEPDWFDFSDYYDTLPVAGFYKGKAIFHTKDLEWKARGEDDLIEWKRE